MAAHRRRTERYELIGARWAETGAGKKQHDIQVAEEKRVLAEAAAKERVDDEREQVPINTLVKDENGSEDHERVNVMEMSSTRLWHLFQALRQRMVLQTAEDK